MRNSHVQGGRKHKERRKENIWQANEIHCVRSSFCRLTEPIARVCLAVTVQGFGLAMNYTK